MKFSPMGIALLGVIAYLSYHAISGDQGLSSWSHLQDEIRSLEEDRNILLEKKERLNLQIARLSGDFIDDDFLEELVRQKFHFVYADECVIEPPELTSQPRENEDLFALSN